MTTRIRLWLTGLLCVLTGGCAGYQLGPTQALPLPLRCRSHVQK